MNIPVNYRRLEGSERHPAPGARLMGPADPNERLSVTIVVRRRSDAPPFPKLEDWRTQPPGSRTFVSREEFAASYGAADEDLQRVADFVRSKGLTVEETSIPRRTVVVSGIVAQFNDAFAVELGRYESPDQTYRGREGFIHVPAEMADVIEGVFGLDNRRIGGHNSGILTTTTLTPPQVAQLYNFPIGTATGQTIGILTFDGGYTPSDIEGSFNSLGAGLTPPTIVEVNIDGASNQAGLNFSNDREVVGDICVASAVAQGAGIAVYFAPNDLKGWVDAIGRAIHPNPGDPTPSVLSTSWYISPGDDAQTLQSQGVTIAFINAVSDALLAAAWIGLTVFAACGDKGSDSGVGDGKAHVQYPGSDPWVTSCGGTTIGNVSGASFTEVTWNDSSGATTGGGVSDFFPLPYYQGGAAVPNSVNDGHQRRGVPDIAGNASQSSGYLLSVQGASPTFGGTSAVAPLYAGLIAVINATMRKPIGFLNDTLYILGGEDFLAGGVSGVFNDINDGASNATNGVQGYTSGPGWDACTGWGSINGMVLLEALRVTRVRVHIDNILDHVPGTPEQVALVEAYPMVKIRDPRNNQDDTFLTLVDDNGFEGFEKEFYLVRTVEIVIEIWRHTREGVKHGKVETIHGQRYIVFGPNDMVPVPPDWDQLPPGVQGARTNMTITPPVSAGFVERFTLHYDLRTQEFSGDATGSSGQQIHLAPDPLVIIKQPTIEYYPEVWFTISQS